MKIALIGYGKMGQTIEKIAKARGHEIVCIIDANNRSDFESAAFASADVAIEFTSPTAAIDNYRHAWKAGVAVVSGTTGWNEQLPQIQEEIKANNFTLFWTSNFSLGVNIFFELNRHLASIMNQFGDYNVSITETHHIHKLDAPSGTAITLAETILQQIDRKDKWILGETGSANELPIKAIRKGEVPGTHTVCYDSEVDTITLTHEAKSRQGLALGAVIAAEFTVGKKGFLNMHDLLKF
ncbi:MAG: 4-hydroxy-tetrahydrodipicolinate reductase [Prevotellaceae bacterium]|nr:4-hydroxy-tetrahydrodipicolinate reductase [Prevotellaceae bacterium]